MRSWPLLLLVGCALAGCRQAPRSAPLVRGEIDTFEDGDRINLFQKTWDALAEGGPTATVSTLQGGFARDSQYHLVVDGYRPPDASGAQVAGVRVSLTQSPLPADPNQAEIARDASAYQGLAFALRGTPGTYIVQLGSIRIRDFDHYNAYVEVQEGWTEYRIPFSQFQQEGFGQPQPWSSQHLAHLALFANVTGNFSFGLDDVRFYK
jgi:hypothetical protein